MIAVDNVELLVQKMENSFVYNLWSCSRVHVDIDPISLVSFINWLGSKWGQVMFFVSLPLPFRWAYWRSVYTYCIFETLFWRFLFLIHTHLFIKKKKKTKKITHQFPDVVNYSGSQCCRKGNAASNLKKWDIRRFLPLKMWWRSE